MTSTSLAEQLKRLSVPQSSIYKDDKTAASLLFEPREAGHKDRQTFYEIGISGLKELIALYEGFRLYEDTLFSISSKDFERAVQTKEVNQNLDQTIEKFLLQISPYLLLQSSHKALEWLVNRYHIHQYNQDAILELILPYHDTMIFIRFIQIMEFRSSRWHWLQPIKKNGIPLSKQVLYNHCGTHSDTLQFISKMTLKYVNEFGNRTSQINTVFAFFCSVAVGTMQALKKVNESTMNALLPTLLKALEHPADNFRASAFIITGYLMTKATIKSDTISVIIDKLLTSEHDFSYDMALLVVITYTHQNHIIKLSEVILNDLSDEIVTTLSGHLKTIVGQKTNIQPFLNAFLKSILQRVQRNSEEFRRFSKLPEILINAVNLKNQQPEKIIGCILESFKTQDKEGAGHGDESDIEFIDEDEYSGEVLMWYSKLLKTLETQYPEDFDKVVKSLMSSNNKLSTKRRKELSKVLGFKPAVAHKIGDAYLFENLNHINPELRVQAVNYISKQFEVLKSENIEFVKESIVNRLNDDNPSVVAAALAIPDEHLRKVLGEEDLTVTFSNIISKGYKKWRPVVTEAIIKFCSLDQLQVNHDTLLAIMPYLFPDDEQSAKTTWHILNSAWGEKLGLIKQMKGVNSSVKDNHLVLKQAVFKTLFIDKKITFDDKLQALQLNKEKTLDVCFYLLLKSCSLGKATVDEASATLNLLLESVQSRSIVSSKAGIPFTHELMSEFIKAAKHDQFLFDIMEYIFTRIIEDTNVSNVTKPWCNVCQSSDTILIRQIFEICVTGIAIPTYTDNYAKLLNKLLGRFFENPREKCEFIANIAFGHILYATDPKDLISPELQLRSLKLLDNFVAIENETGWLYESNVILLTILFNLNNPVRLIREFTLTFIKSLLCDRPDKNIVYVQLLTELLEYKEEMLLDHEQIPQILNKVLIEASAGKKVFAKNCLSKFSNLLTCSSTPAHIRASFLNILSHVNNANAFLQFVPSLNSVEKILKKNEQNKKIILDIYESNLLKHVYYQINENTVSAFSKPEVWNSIECGLKEYRNCLLEVDQTFTSPCVLILKQIDEEVFKKVPREKSKDLVYLIASAGSFSNNPTISSAAAKAIKKIHLNYSDFKSILVGMFEVEDPVANAQKKKKSTLSMLSYELTETNQWKLGVTLLEYVQSKKKMTVDNSFASTLFQLLNKCLRFEEQSYVEYTKQLILSALWYFCRKFVDDKNKEQLKSFETIFKVELIVQCIRGTQNPQTHHHALILLSHAAYMMPEQVLDNTMEIFTFMGTSVLRHDDAYSFQIITKIIETLIPILVKLEKNVEDYTELELQKLKKRVVPVLRIFSDAVMHVPEHRRLPLYKKLIETLGPNEFLWIFLALLLESHVSKFSDENKDKEKKTRRALADQESPINRLDFGQSILLEFPPEVGMANFIKLLLYMKTLPLQKDDDAMDTDVDPSDIFSVNSHTSLQLRHYKYAVITYMSSTLASSRFIHHNTQVADFKTMETHFKSLIVNILTFIQSISKISDEKTAKYWRVMLHHSYELLDNANNLLSAPMFLSVIRGLLKYTLVTVRRKSMELLNSKIQFSPEMFENVDKELIFSLMPPLLDIVKSIEVKDSTLGETSAQELELSQQTALLSLKLLTKMLASENPEPFKEVLEVVTEYTCNTNISGNVMASIVLCLAELSGNLKAHALASLCKFMPALIKVLKKQRKAETPELVLLSTVTAISKIIESLPLFLSPYLQKILYEYSILLAKWQSGDQECSKVSAIVHKLTNIKRKIATSIPPRVLIPVANSTHQLLLEKKSYDAIGPVMSVLADSFANVTTADFTALQQDLTAFFLSALQLRSDAVDKNVDIEVIDRAEDEVVNALVALVLKLSENSFRPFYFKIYDWAIRSNVEGHKDRTITFYRLSSAIADKLKGLFVLFSGHFIKNASDLLDACNTSKTEELYFDSEDKCITLVNYIIKTLRIVFLYDSQSFLNKDRFETLMQGIVDQLENTLGGIESLKSRATESIIPCISQFAVATADDSLWKLLNYQILLKIRHNDPEIRLIALDCLVSTASQLGSSWLPLLAESVPFLAELLEDGDSRIEQATKDAIRKLEQILGEPLEKYF